MNRTGRWLAGIAMAAVLLSVGLLPSTAQETAPAKAETPSKSTESPREAGKPAADADAPVPEEAEEENRAPDERVSADNNLSYPVDI